MISVPSDVLEIAKKLDPINYSQFSMASSRVFCCLYHGRYTTNEGTCAILEQKKEEHRIEQEQLTTVQQDGHAIEHIENPSQEVQLAAVQQTGYAIAYIDNPSEAAVKFAAVRENGHAIRYIN